MTSGAHILLPAAAWGEKSGTVTNSERRISRQNQFLPLPGEAKPDWWIVTRDRAAPGILQLVSRIVAPPTSSASMRLCRHSRMSARGTSISAHSRKSKTTPMTRWRRCNGHGGGARTGRTAGSSPPGTSSRRTGRRVLSVRRSRRQARNTSEKFPFRLNTGRVRDQWHSMTRSGLSPRLGAHLPEPFVEVHPDDARERGLVDGGFARVSTAFGHCVLKVVLSAGQRPGLLFAPIHWSDANASSARIGELVMPATDPYSGQPEAKATPAADYAGEFPLSRLRPDATTDRAAAIDLVVARSRCRRQRLAACDRRCARALAGPCIRMVWAARRTR